MKPLKKIMRNEFTVVFKKSEERMNFFDVSRLRRTSDCINLILVRRDASVVSNVANIKYTENRLLRIDLHIEFFSQRSCIRQ